MADGLGDVGLVGSEGAGDDAAAVDNILDAGGETAGHGAPEVGGEGAGFQMGEEGLDHGTGVFVGGGFCG